MQKWPLFIYQKGWNWLTVYNKFIFERFFVKFHLTIKSRYYFLKTKSRNIFWNFRNFNFYDFISQMLYARFYYPEFIFADFITSSPCYHCTRVQIRRLLVVASSSHFHQLLEWKLSCHRQIWLLLRHQFSRGDHWWTLQNILVTGALPIWYQMLLVFQMITLYQLWWFACGRLRNSTPIWEDVYPLQVLQASWWVWNATLCRKLSRNQNARTNRVHIVSVPWHLCWCFVFSLVSGYFVFKYAVQSFCHYFIHDFSKNGWNGDRPILLHWGAGPRFVYRNDFHFFSNSLEIHRAQLTCWRERRQRVLNHSHSS